MFRKANTTDLEVMWYLHREALGPYIKQIWGWDEQKQRMMFQSKNRLENCELIDIGSIAGQIIHYGRNHNYYLESILIFPFYHGSGLAAKALARVEDIAKKCGANVELQVFKVNTRAIRFYEKNGYCRVGDSEFHYQYMKLTQHGSSSKCFAPKDP